MAALLLQSRFAGLKIEDDDSVSSKQKPKKKPSGTTVNTAVKKSEAPKKKTSAGKAQNAAPQKKKKQKNAATAQQWEQWKQKDAEMVDDNFEDELEQAILLSKLEFEEKKGVYKQHKKDSDMEKKALEQAAKAGTKKQKKRNTMSLEQFNDMVGEDSKVANDEDNDSVGTAENETDTQFFESVADEAKTELLKDKHYDKLRTRKTASDEVITRLQFADALERKQKEIDNLKKEIQKLKAELLVVKSRNNKLCGILGQAEMKDKAEVLIEVERLREVQAELTAEVTSLHTDLEKERSRHPDTKTKDKKKKGGSAEKEK